MILVNGVQLDVTRFHDNTTQVWKLPENLLTTTNFAHITWEFTQEGEFMHLAQLKALLDQNGFTTCLRINYLPYGRQDKDVANDRTFALLPFAKLLNVLKFDEVIIMDPHSTIALNLIDNSKAVYPIELINKIMMETDSAIVCYPDKGAVSKYTLQYPFEYLYGEKVRDQLTGNIISYELIGSVSGADFYGKSVLIVDDICDGGMTFKLLAAELLKAGAAEVNLFVTHGIFSKGLKTLKESGINKVFTKDGEASEHQQQIHYRRL
jgi:ribose-phosphate pyrophosphokinase